MRTRSGVADVAATQSSMRVGGLNMKGGFTRTRVPTTMAHVSRGFWSRG
jgi:beta-glucuronidase